MFSQSVVTEEHTRARMIRRLLRALIAITGALDPEPTPVPIRASTRERRIQNLFR